jgi:hypothetical protein
VRGVIAVRCDAHAERLAVALRLLGTRGVRRDEQRRAARALDQSQRARAELGDVDEDVATGAVEDDVLALVLERLVQLEDPGTELVNIH